MSRVIMVGVYGTLKQGHGNHRLLADAEFVSEDRLTGAYKMISLGGFPGVMEMNDKDTVYHENGIVLELYRVNEDELWALDCLEGHPDFYTRVKTATEGNQKPWIYLLPEAEYGKESYEQVANGCW